MDDIRKSEEVQLLEDFVIKNPELERLEKLLGMFNIFEILDIVNAEIRHSNVLSWLFNPNSNHGLSEEFLKQFLKYFISQNSSYVNADINIFDFEVFNYSDVEIRREWNNIDLIIVLSERSKNVVVTIENKIKTSEHGDQLRRYRKIIENEFIGYEKIYILLSVEQAVPSDENWACFTYQAIADLIGELLEFKKDSLSEMIFNFLNQYNTILRRYLVGNSEIENICQSIYKKHQKALDLIFQYKPDILLEIFEYLQNKIKEENGLIEDYSTKGYVRFTTRTIDGLVEKVGEDGNKFNRVLLFEIKNLENRLTINMLIRPGDSSYRQVLYDFFKEKKDLFTLLGNKLSPKFHTVYQKKILNPNDYTEASIDELSKIIDHRLKEFYKGDLIKINNYFSNNWADFYKKAQNDIKQ